jgi:hypothetical protein
MPSLPTCDLVTFVTQVSRESDEPRSVPPRSTGPECTQAISLNRANLQALSRTATRQLSFHHSRPTYPGNLVPRKRASRGFPPSGFFRVSESAREKCEMEANALPLGGSDQLALVMQKYWTEFAKKGDPNGGGLPTGSRDSPRRSNPRQLSMPPHEAVVAAGEAVQPPRSRRAHSDLCFRRRRSPVAAELGRHCACSVRTPRRSAIRGRSAAADRAEANQW